MLTSELVHIRFPADKRILLRYMDQGIAPSDALPDTTPPGNGEPIHDDWPEKPAKSRRWPLLLGLLLVALIAGLAIYWLVLRPKPVRQPVTAKDNSSSSQPSVDTSSNTSPTAYISKGSDLNLNFTYPASWQVTPASGGNQSDQPITLTSPRTSMADATDQSVVARAVITIRPKGSDLTELDPGTATLALTSIQIAYTSPTKVQHGYPYITFIHLAGGDNPKKLFEEVMITGANKFAAGQLLSPYSLVGLDPVVSVTFYQCVTQVCSGGGAKPLGISQDIWQTSDLGQQALGVFEALQIH